MKRQCPNCRQYKLATQKVYEISKGIAWMLSFWFVGFIAIFIFWPVTPIMGIIGVIVAVQGFGRAGLTDDHEWHCTSCQWEGILS